MFVTDNYSQYAFPKIQLVGATTCEVIVERGLDVTIDV